MACLLRFLEERREITEKFAAEQDTFLREAREKHARELQLLQESHRQHVLSLTVELETRHQAEVDALRASLEREWWALSEARVAELQTKHAAEITALETRHASRLDALESRYLSEMQTLLGLEEQLQKEDVSHHMVLTWVLEKLKLKHDEEPQSTEDGLRAGENTEHVEGVRASWLRGARQVRCGALPFPRTGVFCCQVCQLRACVCVPGTAVVSWWGRHRTGSSTRCLVSGSLAKALDL